jgi:hypothetical protein
MPFQLIHSPAPDGLDQFVEDLATAVRSGEITGLGVIVILKGRRVFVDVFGSMHRYPHESRGFVAELDDCLREIGRKRMDKHTTQ